MRDLEMQAFPSTLFGLFRGGDMEQQQQTERHRESWNAGSLSVIAGLLQHDYPHISTFEVVRLVWSTSRQVSPEIGGIRLLARCRSALATVAEE
jgi:hypothetical protein